MKLNFTLNKKPKKSGRFSLTLYVGLFVFVIQAISILVTAVLAYIFSGLKWIDFGIPSIPDLTELLIFMSVSSIIIGFATALFVSKFPLKPITNIIKQINRLADGDYKARLNFGKKNGNLPILSDISESFNKMAEELEGTETLRSDFINNLSHEFKTPIVSIAGFAKLLKRGNLTEEQKLEYINIIEEESLRLSVLANNVLNLTKVENQAILTDVSYFNLSEQIRSSVLLLEDKWTSKETELSLDIGEISISANEELLKQVWINLLDNAIKFSPKRGTVSIKAECDEKVVSVEISNGGSTISPEKLSKIFNKFYQADDSHSGEGNGVGLAIVKKIVELHAGEIIVTSENDFTSFTVVLPKVQ